MSDPTTPLNLIQRAMQRGALSQEPRRPVESAVVQKKIPASEAERFQERPISAVPLPPPLSPVSLAPTERAEPIAIAKAQPVHLSADSLKAARIITPDEKNSITYNEFRSLKRKLIPMTQDPETRASTRNMVMITSALPDEGKTFTTMNLAIALAAEPNLNVILVDADVVQSTMRSYFQPESSEGLLELLTRKRERLDELLHPCADLPGLYLLFAGANHDAAPELLASRRMADLCAELCSQYPQSIVLFDMPPVLSRAEPAAMAAHADHVIMVVAAGRAGRQQVEAALTEVSRCPSISLVFNRSPEWERPLSPAYRSYGYELEEVGAVAPNGGS